MIAIIKINRYYIIIINTKINMIILHKRTIETKILIKIYLCRKRQNRQSTD